MYFNYNSNTYTCNLDWLQYSVHLSESDPTILCPEGYRLEICQGNNIFEHRAIVFDQRGGKFMTLLWSPYSKVLPDNLMTCQVANEYLYMNGAGVKWSFEVLQQIVDCTFNAIGRVDICLDWVGTEDRILFLKHLNSGHYYTQRKSEGSTWWHEVGNSKQVHCLTWGSPKSDIKVKIYHKSREQGISNGEGEPEKPWIVNEWKQAGMDIKNVWRLEFSLAGAGQLRWNNETIDLAKLQDESWLLQVLLECYTNRFITRVNQGHRNGHHNDDARVWLLDLPAKISHLKWADPTGQNYDLPAAITLLRSMMKQIDNPIVMAHRPTFNTYATAILDIVRDHRLDGYFLRTYEKAADDYFGELSEFVGVGIQHTAPSPRRLMD